MTFVFTFFFCRWPCPPHRPAADVPAAGGAPGDVQGSAGREQWPARPQLWGCEGHFGDLEVEDAQRMGEHGALAGRGHVEEQHLQCGHTGEGADVVSQN
jgi:hypothetical protein